MLPATNTSPAPLKEWADGSGPSYMYVDVLYVVCMLHVHVVVQLGYIMYTYMYIYVLLYNTML